MSDNALQTITTEIASIFQPLRTLDSKEHITAFIHDLGYELPAGHLFEELPGLVEAVDELVDAITALAEAGSDEQTYQALMDLLQAIVAVVKEIMDALDAIKAATAAIPNFVSNSDIDEFPRRLLDYLLSFYLWRERKQTYGILLFIGLLDEIDMDADAAKFQPAFKLRKIWWERFPKYFSEPQNLPEIVYQWESGFASERFLSRLYILFSGLRLPGGLYPQSTLVRNALGNTTTDLKELRMPIFEKTVLPSSYSQFGINASPVEAQGPKKAGFAIIPYIYGEAEFDFNVSEKFEIIFNTSASVEAGIGVIFRPDTDMQVLTTLFDAPLQSTAFESTLSFQQRENTGEIALFGNPQASRLAIEGPGAKVFVKNHGDLDAGFEVGIDAVRLVISGNDGDGFISKIIGDGITAEADLTIGVSKARGVYFEGSGGLEIQVPAHISLGPLEVQGIILALKIKDGDFDLEAGADAKLSLGPLAGVVENIGVTATLTFPDDGGNLGPADLSVGFKPPNGVGLSIDAGVVKGGGYLYFDFDNERYAGALELVFSEFLTLKAIGLITTRMPDGSKGFSLLVIITAEFGSPIQLGFGFTLSGVGGLVGLNRTMRLQPLAEGMRTGAVNSVMFPTNVVENAPRIISDLRNFFPPHVGIFLIGPMAKLGWGTPNLLTLSMGIIIEIPGNIAILGVLKLILPDEKAALLVLQVNFIGAIEFDKKRAWFFASLFESRVLFITIEGEMGILVAWGSDANFVVSVGGFHPAFKPPPLPFPNPKRIAVNILNTSVAKIRVEGYFAVTSNTVQFGARAELFFGLSAFKIEGHIAFDALFQFSPFYMIIEISASLSVKVFGIGLFSVRMRGSLEGPTPWHVEGTGSISLLFFDIDVDFSKTWGEEEDTTLPPIEVMPLLKAELEKLENWKANVPAANKILVSLRELEGDEGLVLHPVGTLEVSQRAVPLDLTLDKVGAQKPSDANIFSLSISGGGLASKGEKDESFAMAQFKNMSDSKKLSSPAYEPQAGGLELSVDGEQLRSGSAIKRVVRYEQIIIDSNYKRFVRSFFNFFGVLFKLFLNGNAATRCALSNRYKQQKQPFADKIVTRPGVYAVAVNSDNSAYSAEAAAFTSKARAEEFMQQQIKGNPALADALHVIPQTELKDAA